MELKRIAYERDRMRKKDREIELLVKQLYRQIKVEERPTKQDAPEAPNRRRRSQKRFYARAKYARLPVPIEQSPDSEHRQAPQPIGSPGPLSNNNFANFDQTLGYLP